MRVLLEREVSPKSLDSHLEKQGTFLRGTCSLDEKEPWRKDTRFQSESPSEKKICRRVNMFWTKSFLKINQISTLQEMLVIRFPLTTLDNNY